LNLNLVTKSEEFKVKDEKSLKTIDDLNNKIKLLNENYNTKEEEYNSLK